MRLAAVPLFFASDPQEAIERSGESAGTTHRAQTPVDACRYFGGLIVGAVNGVDKEALLSPSYCPIPNYWNEHSLHPALKAVANGSFKIKRPLQIRGTGYVTTAKELIAFEPSDKAYKELARIRVADSATHAYPVVSGHRLFVKDQDAVTLWIVQ